MEYLTGKRKPETVYENLMQLSPEGKVALAGVGVGILQLAQMQFVMQTQGKQAVKEIRRVRESLETFSAPVQFIWRSVSGLMGNSARAFVGWCLQMLYRAGFQIQGEKLLAWIEKRFERGYYVLTHGNDVDAEEYWYWVYVVLGLASVAGLDKSPIKNPLVQDEADMRYRFRGVGQFEPLDLPGPIRQFLNWMTKFSILKTPLQKMGYKENEVPSFDVMVYDTAWTDLSFDALFQGAMGKRNKKDVWWLFEQLWKNDFKKMAEWVNVQDYVAYMEMRKSDKIKEDYQTLYHDSKYAKNLDIDSVDTEILSKAREMLQKRLSDDISDIAKLIEGTSTESKSQRELVSFFQKQKNQRERDLVKLPDMNNSEVMDLMVKEENYAKKFMTRQIRFDMDDEDPHRLLRLMFQFIYGPVRISDVLYSVNPSSPVDINTSMHEIMSKPGLVKLLVVLNTLGGDGKRFFMALSNVSVLIEEGERPTLVQRLRKGVDKEATALTVEDVAASMDYDVRSVLQDFVSIADKKRVKYKTDLENLLEAYDKVEEGDVEHIVSFINSGNKYLRKGITAGKTLTRGGVTTLRSLFKEVWDDKTLASRHVLAYTEITPAGREETYI